LNAGGDFMITWTSNAVNSDPVLKPNFLGQTLNALLSPALGLLGLGGSSSTQSSLNVYERQFDGGKRWLKTSLRGQGLRCLVRSVLLNTCRCFFSPLTGTSDPQHIDREELVPMHGASFL
jgi:hypothetical protein